MEPRRIQKVGYSTLSVSIPMNWAKKMSIKKGDIVFLSEDNDGALRIAPEPSKVVAGRWSTRWQKRLRRSARTRDSAQQPQAVPSS